MKIKKRQQQQKVTITGARSTFMTEDIRFCPSAENHIPTIIYGARVRPGQYTERISHYSVLSTLLAMYALPPFAEAVATPPIRAIWD
jgi:hypothetical protein